MAPIRRGRRGTVSSHHYVLSGLLTLVRPTIKGCEGRSRAAFFCLAMPVEAGPSNAGTTFTALVTNADGVIVNSSGMFYTFAGAGRSALRRRPDLQVIRKTNSSVELQSSVPSADTAARCP
jgi:hypothetical protein